VEVAVVLVGGRLLANSVVNSNLVVEVLGGVFSNSDKSVRSSLEYDGSVGELDGGLVVGQVVSTTWQQGPTTPCAVFNFQTTRRDSPVVEGRSTDGNGGDGTSASELFVDDEGLSTGGVAEDGLGVATSSEKWWVSHGASSGLD